MSSPKPSPATVRSWKDRRFGLFIHWGLYSLPAGVWRDRQIEGYSEQIMAHAHIPKAAYRDLACKFNPTLWDARAVAQLAKQAGMKFVVLTSKHHDGFSLFQTERSHFNVCDATPYGQDVVKQMAEACSDVGLEFGVYFSTIDWNFSGGTGIDYDESDGSVRNDNSIPEAHEKFNVDQLSELLTRYGPICEVWFDMGRPTPAQSKEFAATVHRHQPEAMVSGRVFNHCGDFTVMGDNEIPEFPLEEPWQCPASIFDETWGYRSWQLRDDLEGKITEHIVRLAKVLSRGGNYLLNVGPRGDGSLVEFEVEVLKGVGRWLDQNREAVEGSGPQPFRSLQFGSATTKANCLYLFVDRWPADHLLELPGLDGEIVSCRYLDPEITETLTARRNADGWAIVFDSDPPTHRVTTLVVELDRPPVVEANVFKPNQDGDLSLNPADADQIYSRNGAGYYDPPKLFKRSWNLRAGRDGLFAPSVVLNLPSPGTELTLQIGSESCTARFSTENDLKEVEFDPIFLPHEMVKLELSSSSEAVDVASITLRRVDVVKS
jgi:alpha-L-fucosidase